MMASRTLRGPALSSRGKAPARVQRAPVVRTSAVGFSMGGTEAAGLEALSRAAGVGLAALVGAYWLQQELQQQVRTVAVV